MSSECQIACYYFPNYHVNPQNEIVHGRGWTEWELVRCAKSRFDGHRQPRIPLWGYEDESDPMVMGRKMATATDYGIDAFIFDWYWYEDGPFLQRALEQGFLGCDGRQSLKFALMLANHDWMNIHPASAGTAAELLYSGTLAPRVFDHMTDYVTEKYFTHPAYWRIDGCPYFSIYEVSRLIKGFGSIEKARDGLNRFRDKAVAAGLKGLHLNAVIMDVDILPGESGVANAAEVIDILGFDSVTSYVWMHDVHLPDFPFTDYSFCLDQAAGSWRQHKRTFNVPYYPNITMGWDTSPRTRGTDSYENTGYPFMAMIGDNTPEAFRKALVRADDFLGGQSQGQRILTINAWNEWTEGSYLEPDTHYGMRYLEAIRNTFTDYVHNNYAESTDNGK